MIGTSDASTDEASCSRRLVLLTSVFPSPWLPTKGTFNFELARAIARRHELRVVNPISWTDQWQAGRGSAEHLEGKRSEQRDGIHVDYPRYYYPPKVGRVFYDQFLNWSLSGRLRRDVRDFRPEAIVGYWTHPDGTVAVRWARQLQAAAWVMVGGSDILLLAEEPRRARKMRETLRAADGVLVLSQALRDRVLEWGIEPRRVQIFRRGVDSGQFSPGSREGARRRLGLSTSVPILIWVGRMVPVKGLEVLLAAAGRLREWGVEFQLQLVGDGPLRASLEREVASRGWEESVCFAGPRAYDELADWYRAADWTVLSSHSEGVPNVLLESHACGTPFVATRVGGVPDVSVAGFDRLAVPGDVDALACELRAAIAQPPLDEITRRQLAWTVPTLEESADRLVDLVGRSLPSRHVTA